MQCSHKRDQTPRPENQTRIRPIFYEKSDLYQTFLAPKSDLLVFIAQPRLPELVPQQLQQRLWSQPLLNRLFTLWKTSFTGKTYRFQGFQTNFLRFYDIFGDLSDLNRSFWQHIRPKLRFKIRKGPISDLGPTDQTRVAALLYDWSCHRHGWCCQKKALPFSPINTQFSA